MKTTLGSCLCLQDVVMQSSCYRRWSQLVAPCSEELRAERIKPRQSQLAVRAAEEFDSLIKATIAGGGE